MTKMSTKRHKTRAELLQEATSKFVNIKDGSEKRKMLEYIRQTFGNIAAEKARKLSPTFIYNTKA